MAELALDDKGKFLALRMRHLCNQGAYVATAGVDINTNNFARCLPGMYRIPKVDVGVACYFTNRVPIGPYRGAGRPEANYALERVVEEAARIIGMDPVRLRKKNLIPPSAMPFKTAIGNTYDSGDFPGIVEQALEACRLRQFQQAQARGGAAQEISRHRHLLHAGACRRARRWSRRRSGFPGGDKIILGLNVQSTGQGHATVFGRLLADKLGIDASKIEHRHGDTAMGLTGFASVGSRSAMCAGSGHRAHRRRDAGEGQEIAAGLLEASEGDIQYRAGHFEVVGTDRKVSLFDVARRAKDMRREPRHQGQGRGAAHLPQRLPYRRSGDRSRDRAGRSRHLHGGGRLRQSARPHDRRGPGAWLDRARLGAGAGRERGLRSRAGNW